MYSLIYDECLQFTSLNYKTPHLVLVRCIFDIFRIAVPKDESTFIPRTFINISSCYILDWAKNIKKFPHWFVWANELDNEPFDSLSKEEQNKIHKANEKKFNFAIEYFRPFSIFESLKRIYPNLENDERGLNIIKDLLKVDSLNFDEIVRPYAEIMEL